MVVPRALLEKRFGGTRREWRDCSRIITIARGDADHIADIEQHEQHEHQEHQEQQQEQQLEQQEQQLEQQEHDDEAQTLFSTGNNAAIEVPRIPAKPPEVQDWLGRCVSRLLVC